MEQKNRFQALQGIWNITDQLQQSNSLEELLNISLDTISKELGAESSTIWLVGEKEEQIFPYVSAGPNVSQFKYMKLNMGEGLAGWVIFNRTAQIIEDVKTDSRWASRFDQSTGYQTRDILCVPIETEKSCVGCIQLLNKQEGRFDSEDLEKCSNLATMVGLAIHKKGLLRKELKPKEVLLQLEKVSKHYQMGEVLVEALKEVSLEVYKGELLVILGTSGSGKSTLLNLIGGMDIPTKGDILVNKVNLAKAKEKGLTEHRRHEIGFVFQFYNLIPDLTVYENVMVSAELSKKPLSISNALEQVHMESKKKNFPSQLSGGEQQRVAIARALVKNPSILLCDEPTGALDNENGRLVIALLEKIAREENNTVIIVTHNNAFAPMADRVVRMKNGKIVEVLHNTDPIPSERLDW